MKKEEKEILRIIADMKENVEGDTKYSDQQKLFLVVTLRVMAKDIKQDFAYMRKAMKDIT